jgi:putative endonuclease
MDTRPALGRNGEDLAADMYERQGFRILERNFRVAEGELDLVVRRGPLLVFCEVKTRTSDHWGAPAEAVAWRKQSRIRHLAARWMRERHCGRAEIRFDVVSIVVRNGSPEITHIAAAF